MRDTRGLLLETRAAGGPASTCLAFDSKATANRPFGLHLVTPRPSSGSDDFFRTALSASVVCLRTRLGRTRLDPCTTARESLRVLKPKFQASLVHRTTRSFRPTVVCLFWTDLRMSPLGCDEHMAVTDMRAQQAGSYGGPSISGRSVEHARVSQITPRMRSTLCGWLIEVAQEFRLHQDTLHLCISLLDRFLHLQPVSGGHAYLLTRQLYLWHAFFVGGNSKCPLI